MNTVTESLNDIFKTNRLVFWYDPEGKMRPQFDSFDSLGIEKIEASNNEFGLKHRFARQEPDRSFLVYLPYPRPKHTENWLLDLELGNYLFHADEISLVLREMKWQEEHRSFVEKHQSFFGNAVLRERLAERLHKDDRELDWQLKMLSVLAKEEPNFEACLFALLSEHSERVSIKWDEVVARGLDRFFWNQLARHCRYESSKPTLGDFAIELLLAAAPCGKETTLGREAKVIASRWKDSSRYRSSFETLSEKVSKDLAIPEALNAIEGYHSLLDQDAFEAIERKVITDLRDELAQDRLGFDKLKSAVEHRSLSYWYSKYESIYGALLAAAELKGSLRKLDFGFESATEGVERYRATYWKIDQLYRAYRLNAKRSGQTSLLDSISEDLEKRYVNEFLLRLNDRFQGHLDGLKSWPPKNTPYQREFYDKHVVPALSKRKDSKLFVIISDAMRYEVGEELHRRLNKEQRFRSKLEFAVSVLPSYTQLGMAALLPHKTLEITDKKGETLADDLRTAGVDLRSKILAKTGRRTIAIKAKEFLEMNAHDKGRELAREHDLIYIYQNEIDQIGDKMETETDVFEAVEREFENIGAIIRKVAAVNGNNIVVTADHGFLFHQSILDESDYTEAPVAGELSMLNRRFAIGSGFQRKANVACFTSEQLGLAGKLEVALPKSINRFRKSGAGARFVHGGASLQEVVIPVLTINKARQDDVEKVEVDLIRGASNLITTNQVSLTFYQEDPVQEKTLPRALKIGFFSSSGELLSNHVEISFDSKHAEARLREKKVSLLFGAITNDKKSQAEDIVLRLEERVPNSNRDLVYKEFAYRFKKAYDTDFEF